MKCVWTFLNMSWNHCDPATFSKSNIFRITPNVINQNGILLYRWFIPTSHSMLRSTSKGLIKAKGWKDASRHNRIQNCMWYYVHIFNMYYTLLRVYFFIKYFLSRRIQAKLGNSYFEMILSRSVSRCTYLLHSLNFLTLYNQCIHILKPVSRQPT